MQVLISSFEFLSVKAKFAILRKSCTATKKAQVWSVVLLLTDWVTFTSRNLTLRKSKMGTLITTLEGGWDP